MKFRVDEISSVITEEIRQYRGQVDVAEVGRVLEVGDGIARIYGLSNAMAGERLEFSNGAHGQVFNLEESSVGVVILTDYTGIKEGDARRQRDRPHGGPARAGGGDVLAVGDAGLDGGLERIDGMAPGVGLAIAGGGGRGKGLRADRGQGGAWSREQTSAGAVPSSSAAGMPSSASARSSRFRAQAGDS